MTDTAVDWTDIGAVADLKLNPGAAVRIGQHWLGVFRVDGVWRCIDNACPHASAPLCDGTVLNGKVICWLHCWEFDLATGACDLGDEWRVRTYAIREVDGRLQVQLPRA